MPRYEYVKSVRCCATCIYWIGNRTTAPSKPTSAFVENGGAFGQCGCTNSPRYRVVGKKTQAHERCDCYKCWK